MKKPSVLAKPRNLLHNHPLLRKCGVQEKNRKAKRRGEKVVLRKEWPVLECLASAISKQATFFNSSSH